MRKPILALTGLAVLLALGLLLQGLFWLVIRLPRWLFPVLRPGHAWAVIVAALVAIGAGVAWLVTSRSTPVGKAQVALTAAVALLVQPFLVATASISLWRIVDLNAMPESVRAFVAIPMLVTTLLFSDVSRCLAVSAVALILTLVGLAWLVAREREAVLQRVQFYALAFPLVPVVAFPLTFSSIPYRPAVEAAPDVEMHVVARSGWLLKTVRMCRAMAGVTRYQYEPLGWADDETLVYRVWQGGDYGRDAWRSQPGSPGPLLAYQLDEGTVTRFRGDLSSLHSETCDPAVCVEPALAEIPSYHPGRFEQPIVSPNGAWAFDQPEDLLLIWNH